MRLLLLFIPAILLGCTDSKKTKKTLQLPFANNEVTSKNVRPQAPISTHKAPLVFPLAIACPVIKDTAYFISQLKKIKGIEQCDNAKECISQFKKLSLNGSKHPIILVEYSYRGSTGVCFPWKYQVLFTENGKFIKVLSALRSELLPIFPNQYPFLLTLNSTYHGNGWHELYKTSADSLENILDTDRFSAGAYTRTYDVDDTGGIYQPSELVITKSDYNKDGYNDIIFSGTHIYNKLGNDLDDTANNTSKFVKYPFLYQEKTGHFAQRNKRVK